MTIKEKVKKESVAVKREVKKQLMTYMIASLGLVAGLAWNEAIKGLIEYLFPEMQNTVVAKFLYAIILTLFIGIVSYYLAQLMKEKEEEPQK